MLVARLDSCSGGIVESGLSLGEWKAFSGF